MHGVMCRKSRKARCIPHIRDYTHGFSCCAAPCVSFWFWLVPCCFTCEALLESGSQLTLPILGLCTGGGCVWRLVGTEEKSQQGVFLLVLEPMLIGFPSMLRACYTKWRLRREYVAFFAVVGVYMDSLVFHIVIHVRLIFLITGDTEAFSGAPVLFNVRPFCSILQIGQILSLCLNFSIQLLQSEWKYPPKSSSLLFFLLEGKKKKDVDFCIGNIFVPFLWILADGVLSEMCFLPFWWKSS